jgi:hypothetical protein
MERSEIISSLALGVSFLSLAVSFFMAWRTAAAERPVVWVKVEPTPKADCWLVTIHLRNRSKYDIRAVSVAVPLNVVPITKKQKFLMVELKVGTTTKEDGTLVLVDNLDHVVRYFDLHFGPEALVRPGDTKAFQLLLVRSILCSATWVKMRFRYELLKPRLSITTLSFKAHIPPATMTLALNRY